MNNGNLHYFFDKKFDDYIQELSKECETHKSISKNFLENIQELTKEYEIYKSVSKNIMERIHELQQVVNYHNYEAQKLQLKIDDFCNPPRMDNPPVTKRVKKTEE